METSGIAFGTSLAISSGNTELACVGTEEGTITIIDYGSQNNRDSTNPYGKKLLELRCHSKKIRGLCFSYDNMKLLTGSDDSTAKLIDLTKQEPIFTFHGHLGNVNSV